jgi:hypothetical protein
MELKEFKDFKEAEEFLTLVGYSEKLKDILSLIRDKIYDETVFKYTLDNTALNEIKEMIQNIFLEYWNNLLYVDKVKDREMILSSYNSTAYFLTLYLIRELRKRGRDEDKRDEYKIGKRDYVMRGILVKGEQEFAVLSIDFTNQTVTCYDPFSGNAFMTPLITANLKFEYSID